VATHPGIKLDWNAEAVKAKMVERLKRNVGRAAIEVQRSIKKVLSSPGSGKMYRRGQGKNIVRSQITKEVVLKKKSKERFTKEEGLWAGEQGARIRDTGWHRASAPGEAPAADTGTLRRSIQVDLSEINELRAYVGTSLPYAAALELGTRYIAPRPYMRVGLNLAKEKAEEIVLSGIK